jgi:hypothetical protein
VEPIYEFDYAPFIYNLPGLVNGLSTVHVTFFAPQRSRLPDGRTRTYWRTQLGGDFVGDAGLQLDDHPNGRGRLTSFWYNVKGRGWRGSTRLGALAAYKVHDLVENGGIPNRPDIGWPGLQAYLDRTDR